MHHDREDFDASIAELDRILQFLRRTRARQIRSQEDRQLLKATALSWFHSHRVGIANDLSPELLQAIDRPYTSILDASARHASRTTYVRAVGAARQALLAARTNTVARPALSRPAQAPPDFGSLVADPSMRGILERRWGECQRCIEANAPLAAVVMMGGLLEALFVARANRLRDKAPLFSAHSVPIDTQTRKPLDLRKWTLSSYIGVGYDLKWISQTAKDVAAVLRDYRNYIHPERERSQGIALSLDDAKVLWDITGTLSRELLAMRGVF